MRSEVTPTSAATAAVTTTASNRASSKGSGSMPALSTRFSRQPMSTFIPRSKPAISNAPIPAKLIWARDS
jgi:hypothetical protein